MYTHIHTCIIIFLNHLETDCRRYASLVLNISVDISLDQGHFTSLTTVPFSKSANLTDKIIGPGLLPSNLPSFKFHQLSQQCSFTIKTGVGGWGPGSNPRSPFALSCLLCLVQPGTASLYLSWHWHFWGVQLWYFVECLSVWFCLIPTPETRLRWWILGRNTTEKWVRVILSASYQKINDTFLSHRGRC